MQECWQHGPVSQRIRKLILWVLGEAQMLSVPFLVVQMVLSLHTLLRELLFSIFFVVIIGGSLVELFVVLRHLRDTERAMVRAVVAACSA